METHQASFQFPAGTPMSFSQSQNGVSGHAVQGHPNQNHLDLSHSGSSTQTGVPLRARSFSETQRSSSRAEKRMGRLFRQNTTSAASSASNARGTASSTTPTNGNALSVSSSALASNQSTQTSTPILSSQDFHHESHASISDAVLTQVIKEEVDYEAPNSNIGHSNSSSISSQFGSQTSSSTAHSVSSAHANGNASLSASNVSSVNRKYSQSSAINGRLQTISSPDSMFNPTTSNQSTSLQPLIATSSVGVTLSSQEELSKLNQRSFSNKLSTLAEDSDDDQLEKLFRLSKKFAQLHREFTSVTGSLNLDISAPTKNFNIFLSVLQNVENKLNTQTELHNESVEIHLKYPLANSMMDLKKWIENLRLLIKSTDLNISDFQIRLTYYTLFSIFVELSNICQLIVPLPNKLKTHFNPNFTPSFSHNPLSTRSNTISSTDGKNKPTSTTLVRAPQSNQQSAPRQPPLRINKLDRQDSDASNGSSHDSTLINSATEDDKLFDLINHTIQASQAVFSQMNNAIAKGALMIAENSNTNENTDETNELNSIAYKVKDLTNQCLTLMERAKKVKACLNLAKNTTSTQTQGNELHKTIYEQTNLFLKSIISILAATKGAIDDIPTLNEVRSSLSILTRATKELTIKLETSHLKQSVLSSNPSSTSLIDQPKLSSIPSMGNFSLEHQQQQQQGNIQSPLLSQRNTKLKQILEQNESVPNSNLLNPKRPNNHMNLEINTTNLQGPDTFMQQTPLSVTTPLIASIGPAVASAVLPIQSPLKTSSNHPATFQQSIDENVNNNQNATTPSYRYDEQGTSNSINTEYNPFDRIIPRGS